MDPEKAFQNHREGLGPLWTQIHPPIELFRIIPNVPLELLDNYVKDMMARYGMEHVRGGSWNALRLSDQDRLQIRGEAERSCSIS